MLHSPLIMAEEDDSASNRKPKQNPDNDELTEDKERIPRKLDLGIDGAQRNSTGQDDGPFATARSSTFRAVGNARKDDNPFSFRHFLKRDLSLPGNATYEHTGARPKVYANTVQHSPTKLDVQSKTRAADSHTKEPTSDVAKAHLSDVPSNSNVEIPFSAVDSTESNRNVYTNNSEPVYRLNASTEQAMPSLPDFVQDHILVEQVYLNSNGPISVDLDNLPDFTFNTNYNTGSLRRHNSNKRNYDYDLGAASNGAAPLDLPIPGPGLPDQPAHLNLDLTESVNPADRRNMSPGSTFPLDLPSNAGAESMRLPDFLPVHPGRTSPDPEQADEQMQSLFAELERTRSELFAERTRRSRLEDELATARASAAALRAEASAARAAQASLRSRLQGQRADEAEYATRLDDAAQRVHGNLQDTACRASEAELTVARLKTQIKTLKEELAASEAEARQLRDRQRGASHSLRQASGVAERSLRELLAGLEQLKSLSTTLDPT